jgi:flagellar hook-basal body complex protein FliE
MAIPPVGPIIPGPATQATAPTRLTGAPAADGGDFGTAIAKGIEQVSDAQKVADRTAMDVATGGPSGIHDLQAATARASLSVDLLVQVRNRAVEAYQEIMRIQV